MSDRLTVDGVDVAALELATTARTRSKGLLGRDGLDGALWLAPAKQVHGFRMRFDLDVAFVDATGLVLKVVSLPRNRMTWFVWSAKGVLEAERGSFDSWGLRAGSRIGLPLVPSAG